MASSSSRKIVLYPAREESVRSTEVVISFMGVSLREVELKPGMLELRKGHSPGTAGSAKGNAGRAGAASIAYRPQEHLKHYSSGARGNDDHVIFSDLDVFFFSRADLVEITIQ